MTIPISIVILTKNEELALPDCLASLSRFSDVHVVDSASTDRTCTIAANANAHVTDFTWNGRYPKKKQWALDNVQLQFPHVILLDADERLTPTFVDELQALHDSGQLARIDAADVELAYVWAGRRLQHGHKVVKRVLVRRSVARFPEVPDLSVTNMWEVEGHYQPLVPGTTVRLQHRIIHNDPDTPYDYFARHNRYSDWEAWVETDYSASSVVRSARARRATSLHWVPLKPVAFFVYSYFLKAGILDGRAGLDYAVAQSFYYWQIGFKVRASRQASSRG